jgi:hypothetical protein
MNTVLDILKYTIPALIVLIASYAIVKGFLSSNIKQQQLAMLRDNQDVTMRLRLQAYERLVLFIERVHPRQLVPRVYDAGMNVAVLQHVLSNNIKSEFEHNLSQQIYVSKRVWDMVKTVKEHELNIINQIAQGMNPEAPAKELHVRIVDYILTSPEALPNDVALQMINDEARALLQGE